MRAANLAALFSFVVVLPLAVGCGARASQEGTSTPQPTPQASVPPTSTPILPGQEPYPAVRTITVQAKADVLGREIAYLSISFSARGADVHAALDRAEEVTSAIRGIVEQLDVATEIHDQSISAYPAAYGYPAVAYRTISVETPNSSDLSHEIGALDDRIRGVILGEGESVNFFVAFDIEEGGPAEEHARSKAIAEARAAAEQIAQENGLTLGEILSIVEGEDVELSFSAPSSGPAPAGDGVVPAGGSSGGYGVQDTDPVVTVTVTFAVQ